MLFGPAASPIRYRPHPPAPLSLTPLRGQAGEGEAGERTNIEHLDLLAQPSDAAKWRADALAQSGHSRLTAGRAPEPLPTCHADRVPGEIRDPCAEVCRNVLGDFAPALLLLDAAARRRTQALVAFVCALEDCATEPGTDGQRLAALNRWEFALEAVLEGQAAEHPAFAAMAKAEAMEPWDRAALALLVSRARRRSTRLASEGAASDSVAAALAHALFGEPPSRRLVDVCAAILDGPRPTSRPPHEATPVRALDGAAIADAPPAWRAALRFALLVTRAHTATARSAGSARTISATARMMLLVRARWGRA